MSTVLVTGGAGYIGSHTCVQLLAAGHDVVVFDNLCNSSPVALDRVAELAGRPVTFVEGDLRDPDDVARAFAADVDGVIHFAGLKAVGESVEQPLAYYDTNVSGTINLLAAMAEADVHRIVFSSSATVYGDPERIPVTEDCRVGEVTNPYGRTKLIIEQMMADQAAAHPALRVINLRYFNPVGAHESGRIGEDPVGIPNNLMPYVMQVAIGRRPHLNVFGDDYDTPDGTAIRDYIHVVDLADAHLAALAALERIDGCVAVNVGTGTGSSVKDVVDAVGRAVGTPIPFEIAPRRVGDVAAIFADTSFAAEVLGWKATRTLDDMCRDHWRWQRDNPTGYA